MRWFSLLSHMPIERICILLAMLLLKAYFYTPSPHQHLTEWGQTIPWMCPISGSLVHQDHVLDQHLCFGVWIWIWILTLTLI